MSLNDGSVKSVMDELVALAATIHPASLDVYRWWRPDMKLPAVWHWMTPGDVEAVGVPACRVDDLVRVTVTIGVNPRTHVAGDMLEIEAYADLARDVYNAALYARNPLGQRMAKRRGMQTVADKLGDASILCLELPLEVTLQRPVQ